MATATMRRMSADAARRTALAAQGFADPRPSGRIDRRHLRRVFQQIGLIQIDSVNVLARSQELALFARLGPHPRSLIPGAVDEGELIEYWAHEASLLPTAHRPLMRWKMERFERGESYGEYGRQHPDAVAGVLEQVRLRGPLTVGDLEGRVRNKGSWGAWDDGKMALESLFAAGTLSVSRRPADFARRYDLTERMIPRPALDAPLIGEAEARRHILLMASRSLGVATLKDIADYYRLKPTASEPIVAQLVADGELVPVAVEGWRHPAFLHPDAATPRTIAGRALLSPFDSLIWFRERTERLFDFHYRLEIYTPAAKRVYGYYVLPFLVDGHLAGRVDLKADRAAGVLRVQSAWVERDLHPSLDQRALAEPLVQELTDMASWLGLEAVATTGRGTLADDLVAAGVARIGACG